MVVLSTGNSSDSNSACCTALKPIAALTLISAEVWNDKAKFGVQQHSSFAG